MIQIFLGNLHKINEDCSLIDLLCDVYSSEGFADHYQLKKMVYCTCLPNKLQDHNITDEQVALFTMSYKGGVNLNHIARDPVDLKLIVFVKNNDASVFLTCEAKLLQLSKELGLSHWCFKAAIHQLSENVGGVFDESEYKTEQMFDINGTDSFFHYSKNTRCAQCHDNCPTHKLPPSR
ncbi:hypothetical protein [Methylocucumis oryzae]|uniref:Uncharacterized protein n=1 Tax=Methylocucumis oryzae TaxID=1632867 RepID=A0A0F3IMY3_9GAMM|nr:hypothetical protein [Methylocucumis oryzae]KJV07913.1 hypothetical protein VZ94_01545 [Methylocucumis oryzae]